MIGSANRVCPACDGDGLLRHRGATWAEDCSTCAGRGYIDPPAGTVTVTLSEIATTPTERARIRSSAKYRRGFARTARGQERKLYKQNGQNLRDQRPD